MVKYDKRALGRLMVARGWGDADVARRARTTRQNVNHLRRGLTEPRASTIARLANAFGVRVDAFYGQPAA